MTWWALLLAAALVAGGFAIGRTWEKARPPRQLPPAPGRVLAELEIATLKDGTRLPIAHPLEPGGHDQLQAWMEAVQARCTPPGEAGDKPRAA